MIQVCQNQTKDQTKKTFSDGSVEICHTNGSRKVISADGKTKRIHFCNGDVKETCASGLVKYFYAKENWQFVYPNKKEVLVFNKYVTTNRQKYVILS